MSRRLTNIEWDCDYYYYYYYEYQVLIITILSIQFFFRFLSSVELLSKQKIRKR